MSEDTLNRLRRLGVVKGARQLQSPDKGPPLPSAPNRAVAGRSPLPKPEARYPGEGPDEEPRPVEHLLPGSQLVATAAGDCLVQDLVYPLAHRHGPARLGDLLGLQADFDRVGALLAGDDQLGQASLDQLLFLDTETTGLYGAGTLAFLVGVGFFDGPAFVVRQYFLRDHADESAMLLLLADLARDKAGLVTFNGRSFDVPLLANRYLLNRQDPDLDRLGQLDLLPPARRLWRRRLGSCALNALERGLLNIARGQEDVPGALIPALYHDYLRHGDGRELTRVFYHNEIDILSMVALAQALVYQVARPAAGDEPADLLSLARWQLANGRAQAAEQQLLLAAAQEPSLDLYHHILFELSYLYKRQSRWAEAVPLWQQIAVTSFDDVTAHEELAKYYEWRRIDLPRALAWTEKALALLERRGSGASLSRLRPWPELKHRQNRLQRKLEA